MGSALRKLKSARGNTKLCDGKTLGGRGRLTAERIENLQIYYGLAIRRNKGSVSRMKKEIWAGLEHTASTDEKPQHGNCPDHEGTWCKFKAAQRNVHYQWTEQCTLSMEKGKAKSSFPE